MLLEDGGGVAYQLFWFKVFGFASRRKCEIDSRNGCLNRRDGVARGVSEAMSQDLGMISAKPFRQLNTLFPIVKIEENAIKAIFLEKDPNKKETRTK